MVNLRTIDSFFKPREITSCDDPQPRDEPVDASVNRDHPSHEEEPPLKTARIEKEVMIESEMLNMNYLIRDPGLRFPILDYPISEHDKIRRAYVQLGPYQLHREEYPFSGIVGQRRRFQESWFKRFFWLQYSKAKDVVFCLKCYLFSKKPIGRCGSDTFTIKGFNSWRKVNKGKDCAFVNHEGKTPKSAHNYSLTCYENFKNQPCHIEHVTNKQTPQEVTRNRLRLKTSIEAVKWLTFQACAFRGHDEKFDSRNQGNFLELLKLLASYNNEVSDVVLGNASKHAKYTCPDVQKEILCVFAMNVQEVIRDEIGNAKFCLIVDEARDESKKEQMAIVVRFVDRHGYVKERLLDLVHVKDTTASTLKQEISSCLLYHKLDVQNCRGQGYDGASNMRGEWNGLQALFLRECPYAYYVHCFAHQLQLALVAASKDVNEVHNFFQNLSFIVNFIGSSCKRNDQLQAAQLMKFSELAEIRELEGGKGANQIRFLQRPVDTRWSSHFRSICSLMSLFGPSIVVLDNIAVKGSTTSQRGDADSALRHLLSFDFVLVMHVMKEIVGITDILCQALQKKSQDIVNDLTMLRTTKILIQKLRDEGWHSLLINVTSFCESHNIPVPDMSGSYNDIILSRRRKENISVEHHYRVEVYFSAIDHQLQELNYRFNESVTELFSLIVALDPRNAYKSFSICDICKLAEKFYPSDFTEQEKLQLRHQLQHYEIDVLHHEKLGKACSISKLCIGLQETGKSDIYPLIDRLLRLVLTLPVSIATSERAFSAMKIVKTRLRSSMNDEFLKSYLIVYIEREIAETLSIEKIIDDFSAMKERRARFK